MVVVLNLHDDYDKALNLMVSAIKNGKVFVYPTDTVYGLGCAVTSVESVKKIYELKKRPSSKPVSFLFSDLSMILEWCHLSEEEWIWIMEHLPGPYTILLRLKENMYKKVPYHKHKKIGVRVPDFSFIRKAVELSNIPIITTSANISGHPAPPSHQSVSKEIYSSVDLFICHGFTKYKKPSKIIDLEHGLEIR